MNINQGFCLLDNKTNFIALSINNLQDGINLIKEKFVNSHEKNIDDVMEVYLDVLSR